MRYADRDDAGRALVRELRELPLENPIVLGLPRGGVPVAAQVARAYRWPMDVIVSRKLGAPSQPELGLGAVSEGDMSWIDAQLVQQLGVRPEELDAIVARERDEVRRRAARFRRGRPFPDVHDRTVIVVDDGIATGGTIRAALRTLRPLRPRSLVLAVPVGARDTVEALRPEVDELVVPLRPSDLFAIGAWYDDFRQVADETVIRLLDETNRPEPDIEYPRATAEGSERVVRIDSGGVMLAGDLNVPAGARGIVVFAHGSGSSRRSTRNRAVAERLRDAGCATLLFDLLTEDEEREDEFTSALRFDLPLLTRRLVGAIEWVRDRAELRRLPIGLFGASTGAAAALIVAALRPSTISAVVSRGGRPDLALPSLESVRAPTLLIVGGHDAGVLEVNQEAFERLTCHKKLAIVPGATHLFEEPGALEQVAFDAARWFVDAFRVAQATTPATGLPPAT